MTTEASDRPRPGLLRRARDWASRARRHVMPEDLLHLEPFHVLFAVVGYANPAWRKTDWGRYVDERDPDFVDVVLDVVRPIAHRYFGLRVRGLEHLPTDGPALIVGNHNGGVLMTDTFFTALAIRDRFGPERELSMLGHDLLAADDVMRDILNRLGVIRAHPESAGRALRAGRLVLVYPGSDRDSWRTWSERGQIFLEGRAGFVRLALREGVPIIPLVTAGTHEQLVVLRRGLRIARALRLDKMLRNEAFPIVFSLPWGVTTGFLPYLPLPAQTTLQFGAPITWSEHTPEDAERSDVVEGCLDEVRATMQGMLDELHEGRIPVIGERFSR